MEPRKTRSENTGTPSFVKPFLYAMDRIQEHRVLLPGQVTDRSRMLLVDRLGTEGQMPESAFAHGSVGIIADHTAYFDGFALLLRLRQGLAVSLRRTGRKRSRFVVPGSEAIHEFDIRSDLDGSGDDMMKLIARRLDTNGSEQFDIALAGTLPADLGTAHDASFCVAMMRALHALRSETPDDVDLEIEVESLLSEWSGGPISPAFPIAAVTVSTASFLLVDTRTRERITLDAPGKVEPGWGLIWFPEQRTHGEAQRLQRRKWAEQALQDLKDSGLREIESLRDLEHRDLDQALERVPKRRRAAVRHLVTENRNVQKLVAAIRRTDWQFFGALMMISQASQSADWNTTDRSHQAVVRETEAFAIEGGIHGVVQTGEGGLMLVLGQPFSVPAFLDRIKETADEYTTGPIETFIL